MNISRRCRIFFPLVSALAAFAISAHAEEQHKPAAKAAPVRPAVQAVRPGPMHAGPGSVHAGTGPRACGDRVLCVRGRHPGEGRRWRMSGGAACPRITSPDMPITATSPGRVDIGTMKFTTDATAGGGTWAEPGIFTRSRWMARPTMCPMLRPLTMPPVPMGRPVEAGYAPPPGAYAPPPPPPDPAASAVGGAIVGGLLGGLVTHRPGGAAAGAIIGGTTGALVGAEAAQRPGYYLSQGGCYYRYPSGQYVPVDPRSCN